MKGEGLGESEQNEITIKIFYNPHLCMEMLLRLHIISYGVSILSISVDKPSRRITIEQ
jgi:hypothetical protein